MKTAAAALAFWLATIGGGQAETAANGAMDADVRCLASIQMMPELNKQTHQISDDLAQTTALIGSMYYMGKITGRDPQFDIENALINNLPHMATQEVKSNLVRCGGELQAQGKRWNAIGSDLIRRGQEMLKQQNASPNP